MQSKKLDAASMHQHSFLMGRHKCAHLQPSWVHESDFFSGPGTHRSSSEASMLISFSAQLITFKVLLHFELLMFLNWQPSDVFFWLAMVLSSRPDLLI